MSLINQQGFYHGVIIDGGLGQSTNGFPQEVLALRADQVYDPEGNEYLPADPENNEITWYGVLIDSKDKETRNSQQLKKVTGWDGASLVILSEMELVDVPIAFRVEERTWNDNTRLEVTWIDILDASSTRTVQKLDKADVLKLQQRYAGILTSTKAPAKPVSAKSASAKAPTKPKAPKVPKAPKKAVGKCTANEAYNECYQLKQNDVSEDALNDIWQKVIEKRVASTTHDENKFTNEDWFQVKDDVLKQVSRV